VKAVVPPAVVVDNLRKRYGAVAAVDGVTFSVEPGEIFGLIGPNGAGKTTTVECIVGLRQPDEGRIAVCGIDARRDPREARARVGAALQTTALQDKITPREALELFGALYGSTVSAAELIDRFGLEEKADSPFDALSGGQKQRVALALAFVNDPDLIVLDEPTAGLDPPSRRDLRARISAIRGGARAVLLTTHDMSEAQELCDRLAIINHGRIIATGTPAQVTARSTAMPTVSITTTPALAAGWLDRVPHLEGVTYHDHGTRFRTARLQTALPAVLHEVAARNVELTELHVLKASLEDVVIELTSTAAHD
jgi:ABC-2 type transport system ATP-binding protein